MSYIFWLVFKQNELIWNYKIQNKKEDLDCFKLFHLRLKFKKKDSDCFKLFHLRLKFSKYIISRWWNCWDLYGCFNWFHVILEQNQFTGNRIEIKFCKWNLGKLVLYRTKLNWIYMELTWWKRGSWFMHKLLVAPDFVVISQP